MVVADHYNTPRAEWLVMAVIALKKVPKRLRDSASLMAGFAQSLISLDTIDIQIKLGMSWFQCGMDMPQSG